MRALLTETERAVLSRASDPSDNYVGTVRSRFRSRLGELEADVAVLAEYEPDLLAELLDVIATQDAVTVDAADDEGLERS